MNYPVRHQPFIPGSQLSGLKRVSSGAHLSATPLDWAFRIIDFGKDIYEIEKEADIAEDALKAAQAQAAAAAAAAAAITAAAAAGTAQAATEIIPGVPNWLILVGGVGLVGGAIYAATR